MSTSYTPTIWTESGMSTADKLTALDNLESMYTEAATYIDAINHDTAYYTEAQAAARYYDATNDGAGSGLICTTLDGLTADELFESVIPTGSIAIWSGSVAAIPAGWAICDGNGDTIDLRGLFVVGAGGHYTKGDTGGSATVTVTATVDIADHILTAAEIPKHTHGTIVDYYGTDSSGYPSGGAYDFCAYMPTITVSTNTGSVGGGGAHGHTATFATSDASQSKLPPYFAACFIMKV